MENCITSDFYFMVVFSLPILIKENITYIQTEIHAYNQGGYNGSEQVIAYLR